MPAINYPAVFVGAVGFFMLGALWYTILFGGAWGRLTGIADEMASRGRTIGGRPMRRNPTWLVMGLCFAFELLISLTLGHQYAMTGPSDRAKMMIAFGYGAMLLSPGIGIMYLFQMRPGKLFAIDAAYLTAGTTLLGVVHCWLD
jgi:hypothetical protein